MPSISGKHRGSCARFWVAGNEYLQSAAPWALFKTDPNAAAASVRLSLNLIALYAVLSAPFIPDASETILDAMGVTDADWPNEIETALTTLKAGDAFTVPDVLFAKITDDAREEMRMRFSGQQSA